MAQNQNSFDPLTTHLYLKCPACRAEFSTPLRATIICPKCARKYIYQFSEQSHQWVCGNKKLLLSSFREIFDAIMKDMPLTPFKNETAQFSKITKSMYAA
jgi:hypothetical protein